METKNRIRAKYTRELDALIEQMGDDAKIKLKAFRKIAKNHGMRETQISSRYYAIKNGDAIREYDELEIGSPEAEKREILRRSDMYAGKIPPVFAPVGTLQFPEIELPDEPKEKDYKARKYGIVTKLCNSLSNDERLDLIEYLIQNLE